MANNLLISYDLKAPGQNYSRVIDAIKQLGSWAKVHYSLFYVSSQFSAEQARDHVQKVVDSNDTVFVVNATANDAAWFNVSPAASAAITSHWSGRRAA